MLRTSSSTISPRLPANTASALCIRSSIRRFCSGSLLSTRWRKSAVSSSSRSGLFTSLRMIVSAYFRSRVSSAGDSGDAHVIMLDEFDDAPPLCLVVLHHQQAPLLRVHERLEPRERLVEHLL